jgi:hypothetical protein
MVADNSRNNPSEPMQLNRDGRWRQEARGEWPKFFATLLPPRRQFVIFFWSDRCVLVAGF